MSNTSMSYYREQLENWLKTIDVKAEKVIDVGGASNPVNTRVKSWDVTSYLIYDNGLEEGKTDLNMDINYPQRDIVKSEADVVFCLEVFEYIWNPVQACKNIFDMLKENGVAYISFPFVYPQHNPVDYDYLRYTRRGAEKLLFEAGFMETDIIERGDRSGLLKQFYQADGMHPAKGEDHSVCGMMVEAIK